MISRDYTQEIGIPTQKKTLPKPIAYTVLAVVAAGVSFGVAGVIERTKEHHEAEKAAASSSQQQAYVPGVLSPDSAAAK